MVITIYKTIGKVGHSYYIRIPKAFLKEGVLKEGKKYKISIEEAEKPTILEKYETDLDNSELLEEIRQANENDIEEILKKKFFI